MMGLFAMSLRLDAIHKRYGSLQAVQDVSLELPEGETLALLGPSGCGKSTLLRLIAGLEPVSSGRILLDGHDITGVPPQSRGFGMVFQDYALFPHLNVFHNVAFGLLGVPVSVKRRRVQELLELVGLSSYERRRTFELSGGEQQRVALARALAPQPKVLLLDEPLSNLDFALRETLKRELARILDSLDIRAIYVTHDQGEAFALADRIAIMRRGQLVQEGAPDEVYAHPADPWVAGFLGHSNLYSQAVVGAASGPLLLRHDLIRLGAGSVRAEVRSHKVVGGLHHLQLYLPERGLRLAWQGFSRELPGPLQPGDAVMIDIPDAAWQSLPAPPLPDAG
jgi:ABC-type Fe3+/spermidine/putrescine transport system ATPase subunit